MVAVLTRIFGVAHLVLIEDVVQEALLRALEVWKVRGVPENPGAWLLTTAKNCALDAMRRGRTAIAFGPAVATSLQDDRLAAATHFDARTEQDDQLRLMFSCCQPRLSEETQVALILHILCGFSGGEIASAFLCCEEAIKKRITRGKAVLASSQRLFELSDRDFTTRLSSVPHALYLLFNEGYHGASSESAVREASCQDAMRLASLLACNPLTTTPTTHALAALMCFHAARLPARLDSAGDLNPLLIQDRSRWDPQLIEEGQALMDLATTGTELSAYHIEACIAALHASVERIEDTPWDQIVTLYDTLVRLRPSPVVALNRALAVAERDGPESGLNTLLQIHDRMIDYPFYFAALGELEFKSGRPLVARAHFSPALASARSPTEKRFLERRIRECSPADA